MQKYFLCFCCNKWRPVKQKVEVEIPDGLHWKKVSWCKGCKDIADGKPEKVTKGNIKDLINSGGARIKT